MKTRSIIYIDGFNFYYGAVRGSAHRWLDLERLFTRLRPDDRIRVIHYFTALVSGSKRASQERYLRALATLPKVNVILGRFKAKQVRCRVTGCDYTGSRMFDATEEKRTDVNIALQMLDDAHHDRADRFVLVSGDSDLVPAVDLIKQQWPAREIIVYVPSRNPIRGAAVELRSAADKDRTLPLQLLPRCQFPATVSDGHGGVIAKPDGW
ncbi:MAG: NYN domain-containing protein [Planctomycetes bacterium]|nr:NYN domain-containing protein [Planctomycetota bacterium]